RPDLVDRDPSGELVAGGLDEGMPAIGVLRIGHTAPEAGVGNVACADLLRAETDLVREPALDLARPTERPGYAARADDGHVPVLHPHQQAQVPTGLGGPRRG